MIALNDCGPEILQLATNYAADYLNYVENLPFDLQRKVTKLREIDLKCREYVKEIEQLYENFKKENDGNGTVRRRSYLLQIRRLFGLCKELGDEKISIVQSLSEVIESRNKQLEYGRKRFQYAYEPNVKSEHGGKKEKDLKSDSSRGHKRSRRQRNNNSLESKEKILHYNKDQDKTSRSAVNDNTDEPTSKIFASLTSPEQGSPTAIPALTRAALREEDKRINNKTKDKKDEKVEKDEDKAGSGVSGGKNATETVVASTASASTSSSSRGKNGASAVGGASTKSSTKGKKKKRKSNKYQTERHASNSGEVSPLIDVPIDPYEPTYCLCQQVSFGQMIGCDNPKCPIEWFHFSCVRLTHKPKGKWYCPDCTIKRKRENKRADNR